MSAPRNPPPGVPPRYRRLGGYCINADDVRKWGSRLLGEELTIAKDSPTIKDAIRTKSVPLGIYFREVGEETDTRYMFPTHSEEFKGYKDMPASEIPQFELCERDNAVKKLLEEAGITEYYYATVLD